jgi:hypothetical protein
LRVSTLKPVGARLASIRVTKDSSDVPSFFDMMGYAVPMFA